MALKYFINGGVNNNYTDNTNWSTTSGGANDTTAPTISDDVRLDGASPNCVLNASSSALTLICTGYTNTLSGSAQLTVAGSITFVAGMILNCTGLLIISAASTIAFGGLTWGGGLTFSGVNTKTITSDVTINGILTVSNITTLTGLFNLNVAGSVVMTDNLNGNATLILNGTGSWSGSGRIATNLIINTSGTITVSGLVYYSTRTFSYISGTVTTTSSTLNLLANCTIDIASVNWNNVRFTGSNPSTFTLTSDLIVLGDLSFTASTGNVTVNGNNIYVSGNLSVLTTISTLLGTSDIHLVGTGIWNHSSSSTVLRNNLIINTSGTITVTGTKTYGVGTITYTSGTVITTGSTMIFSLSTTLNTNGIIWNNITISATATLTINSTLTGVGTLTLPNAAVTFTGTHGFDFNNVATANLGAARIYTLASTKTYTINNSFTSIGNTTTFRPTFKSSIAASQAILTLGVSATQDLKFVNATDIDSSAGQTINSNKGTLDNATNWYRTNGTFMYLMAS